jgi:signal transduction histidine kinase
MADGAALLAASQEIQQLDDQPDYLPLLLTWRAALHYAMGHDQAAHLNEQLVEANRARQEAQDLLTRTQTLATLGEVAAGAAHEMNNPLTIISGRAQLLASQIREPSLHRMVTEISEESHRLSDMITALRSFAEPLVPKCRPIDLADVVVRAVQQYGPGHRMEPRVNTTFAAVLPSVEVDPDLIGQALGELVRNAVEAKGSRHIELRVQIDPVDDRLSIEVRDDGTGLSSHALRHAFDPFFSEKPAGRQPGLGLARARRAVEAHGGRISLVNGPSGGAIATIWLDDWRTDDTRGASKAARSSTRNPSTEPDDD